MDDRKVADAAPEDLGENGLKFVELSGKDRSAWAHYRERYFERLINAGMEAARRIAKIAGPRGHSLASEAKRFSALGLSSLEAFLERPIIENHKRKLEIAKQLDDLRSSREDASIDPSHREDMLADMRRRKIAYDAALRLMMEEKLIVIRDGEAIAVVAQNISENDIKDFLLSHGYMLSGDSNPD